MSRSTITLKKPHAGQRYVMDNARRFNVVACGRRWGKTDMGIEHLALPMLLQGYPVGWFAPTYKLLDQAWGFCLDLLEPMMGHLKVNKAERTIRFPNKASFDFWTLKSSTSETSSAGRGRKYKRVIVDEAAFAPYLMADWTKAIRPTLTDLQGDAYFPSTLHGQNDFWRLFSKGVAEDDWASFQMPTVKNPFILPSEIAAAEQDMPRDAFAQEYLAEFLADAANPFGITHIRACAVDAMPEGPVVSWGFDFAKSMDHTVGIGLNARGQVCAFQRWQGDWRNTIARVKAMIGETPATVDQTGVGDPITEELQAHCSQVEGYTFTQRSKQQLFEGLAVAIQNRRVAYHTETCEVLINELESFQYVYGRTGVKYSAPEGLHDDCVDALALAWHCHTNKPAAPELILPGADTDLAEEAWGNPMGIDIIWEGI